MAVVGTDTDDLLSEGPGSLNSHQSKAVFYVFHIAPEWLAIALFLSVNVRRLFGRGSTFSCDEGVVERNAAV